MVRQGFGVVDANAAYEEVTAVALGSAVMTTRERAAVESGASLRAAHQAVVASHPDHDLPYLESLLEEIPLVGRRTLRDRVDHGAPRHRRRARASTGAPSSGPSLTPTSERRPDPALLRDSISCERTIGEVLDLLGDAGRRRPKGPAAAEVHALELVTLRPALVRGGSRSGTAVAPPITSLARS